MTERIIGLGIGVHRALGPGLLESVDMACLCRDMERAGLEFGREVPIPLVYRGETIPLGFRADIIVANTVLLEIKAVAAIAPAHVAQILTYLRLSRLPAGLLMNFHERRLVDGVSRYAI
nr:GxxExxY protein [uncultured Rhodopila sp.]